MSAGRTRQRVEFGFLLRTSLVVGCFVAFSGARLLYAFWPANIPKLWGDAHVYFEATDAWVRGLNPWSITFFGIPFAAPPPALLLNLPLLPLGEDVAVATWILGSFVSIVYLVRQLRLPWYWLLCFPFVEGFVAGSPDLVLAALATRGIAWLAVLTKPYSAPSVAAHGRWVALVVAGVLVLLTVPLLPWGAFVAARDDLGLAFDVLTTVPSAWGEPLLMALTAVSLLTLRRSTALDLATPALFAQQPHYLVFSLETISRSTVLSLAATLPVRHAMAVAVVIYAVAVRSSGPRSAAAAIRRRTSAERNGHSGSTADRDVVDGAGRV